jgi:hypothetical protein
MIESGEYVFGRAVRGLRLRVDGKLRAEAWRDRWAVALVEALWPRRAMAVVGVDQEHGTITLGESNR